MPRDTKTSVAPMTEPVNARREYYISAVECKAGKHYLRFKRLSDILLAAMLLLVLIVPMVILGILVYLTSKGPAIFRQERLGLNGKPFLLLKFRSMRVDAEKDGPCWAKDDDERCTKFGRFLRKTRLDELPQLWNILMGDMSFVGPRPERPVFYEEFETYIHGFKHRLAAKPGLTGWAQVNGGYDLRPEEKIVYDMEYIQACSFRMDLKCMLMSFRVVITQKGAR